MTRRSRLGYQVQRAVASDDRSTLPEDPFRGLHEELTATMRVVCAYCGTRLDDKPCIPRMATSVSHGTCRPCDKALRQRLGLGQEEL